MTKNTGTGGGDIEGSATDWTELRRVLAGMQTANQASLQQLGDTVSTLAARIEALTTALTARVDPQGQPVAQDQLQHPLPPPQHHRPPPHQVQQQPLPPQQHHPRAPPRHQLHQQQHFFPPPPHDQRQHHRIQNQYPIEDDEDDQHHRVFLEDLQQQDNYDNRWERSFRVDIPEFHGGLRGDDLVDWLISVEEILEFKQVPPARRVPLVAMRFRGHAATWWKQLKTTRSRTGKPPVHTWEKLTKHLRQTFLPHNYERTMYTRLQNLRQGNRSVDDYAEEFALLLTRNEINESQVQLVSRFIGGLRPQLQTAMAQFDPFTIGEAHRRAASFEQQTRSSNWSQSSTRSRPQEQSGSNTSTAKEPVDAASSTPKQTIQDEQPLRRCTRPNALHCYSCGEQGHRQTASPHATRRGLLIDDTIDEQEVYDSQEEEDNTDDHTDQPTPGDHGRLLVLRRACLAPVTQDDKWLRTNIFRSTCTIKDRICSFVIDSGSCRNVVSE